MDPLRLESFLADEVFAASVVPIACPATFGQNDRYELLDMIAQGARSWVYHARDRHFGAGADVAIKLFRKGARAEEGILGRQVRHTNVIHVLDRGVDPASGFEYVVTDYAANGTLADVKTPMPVRDAVRVVIDLAHAANAAHQAGVVHCDIKPKNVLIDRQHVYKLADFELAHDMREPTATPASGTPAFMAPEQWRQQDFSATPAADVYALGGVLFWLLTGQYPNGASHEEAEAIALARIHRAPLNAPMPIRRIIERALARDPDARFASAEDLAADLNSWLHDEPIAWLAPSPTTRAVLWAKRKPRTAAVVVLTGASLSIAIIAALQVHNAKLEAEVRAKVLGEQKATKLFTEKSEAFGRDLNASFEPLFDMFYDVRMTESGSDALLGGMIDPQLMTNTFKAAELDNITKRAERLESELDFAVLHKLDHSNYYLNLRICLAADLLMIGREGEVKAHTDVLKAELLPKFGPDDPLKLAVDLLDYAAAMQEGDTSIRPELKEMDAPLHATQAYPNVRRAVWQRMRGHITNIP